MMVWKCPQCGDTMTVGVMISVGENQNPKCQKDGNEMVEIGNDPNLQSPMISIGAQVRVGGSVNNSGSVEVFPDGRFIVDGDLINTGSLKINDPQKIKELLVELVNTTGNLAELGNEVLKRFFGAR